MSTGASAKVVPGVEGTLRVKHAQISIQRRKDFRAAFDVIDTDKSGTITVHELGVLARMEGIDLTDDQLLTVMRQMDFDGDPNTLTFEEFCLVMGDLEGGSLNDIVQHFMKNSLMKFAQNGAPLFELANADGVSPFYKWQISLAKTVDGSRTQAIILFLIVVDVFCVLGELLLVATECHPMTDSQHKWEMVLKHMSLTILGIFQAQIILTIIAYDIKFFKSPFYVMDLVIISGSLVMESVKSFKGGGLFVLLLSWRVLRIIHGLFTSFEIENHETHKKLNQTKKVGHQRQLAMVKRINSIITNNDLPLEAFAIRIQKQIGADFLGKAKLLAEKGDVDALKKLAIERRDHRNEAEDYYIKLYGVVREYQKKIKESQFELEEEIELESKTHHG